MERARAKGGAVLETPPSVKGGVTIQLRSSQERFQLADELIVMLSDARNEHALNAFEQLDEEERKLLLREVMADVLSPTPTLIGPHQRPNNANNISKVTRRMAIIRLLERRGIVSYEAHLLTAKAFADHAKLFSDLGEDDRASVIQAALEIEET